MSGHWNFCHILPPRLIIKLELTTKLRDLPKMSEWFKLNSKVSHTHTNTNTEEIRSLILCLRGALSHSLFVSPFCAPHMFNSWLTHGYTSPSISSAQPILFFGVWNALARAWCSSEGRFRFLSETVHVGYWEHLRRKSRLKTCPFPQSCHRLSPLSHELRTLTYKVTEN